MSNFNQPFPNLQEELYYMEQQQQQQPPPNLNYNQRGQTDQGQGFGQTDRAMDPVERYQMEGPSFTGEASVFHQGNRSRSRERRGYSDRARSPSPRARDDSGYNESRLRQSGSYERSHSRKRSHSRERDNLDYRHRSRSRSPSGDYRSGGSSDPQLRLQETLKRLQQLEEQQRVQDQLLKDVRVHLVEKPTSEPKRRRIDEEFHRQQTSPSNYGMQASGYGDRDGRDPQGSSFGPRRPNSANPVRKPACFNCGDVGHLAAQCPGSRHRQPEPGCFNCGKLGHIASKCPTMLSRQREQDPACFKCGRPGHIAAQCPAGLRQSDPACFNCGRPGHVAAKCPAKSRRESDPGCFNCGRPGHIAAQCPAKSRPREPDPACFNCGRPGHIAAQCPAKSRPREPDTLEGRCFRCGVEGHQAKHCKLPRMMSPGLGDQQRKSSTDGAHLDQGILGKIQNAHIKCYRCEGFGHYVRDCPTKHTSAALTITPSKNLKKNASSKDRTGPVHIDPETALVIDTIWGMAKTHYPTPKGCKTRLEIDDNLKRKGDNHKIANKDVPPPPRQSDTTLSNQCDILDKLWWKDMLYDRILENLYCLMCQKGFRTIKQYQDHVNGRMHRNLNSTLLSAKTGWAVRTKLLKKLGSLPTIFEEPLPGEDKKPFPDIKSDLLSENIFNKKFFVCRVCKTWGETPLQSHFESKRHKFLYENQWKCEVCNMYFKGYQDFKIHADSLIHTQVMKKTKGIKSESPSPTKESEDDTTPKRKRSSEASDKSTAAKKSKYSTRSLTEEEEGLIEMVWTSDDQWSVANVGESTSAVHKSQDLTEKKPSEESSESESEEATKSTKNEDDEDEEAVPGLQFLIPVTGFYCKLCGKFYNEDKMPKKEHCLTKVHRSKVKLWYRENNKRTIADETGLDEKESEGADKIKVKDEDGKTGEEESEVLVKDEEKDEDEVLKEDEVLEKEQKVNEKEQQPSEEVNDERLEDEVVSEDQQIIALDEDTSTAVISVGNVDNVERLQQEQEDLDVDVVGDEVVEDDKGSKADGSEPEPKMDVDADETAGDDSELKSKEPPGGSEGEESKANAADNVKDEIEDSQLDENNQQEVLADAAENNEDDDEEPDLVNTADSEDDEGAMLPGDAEDSGEDEPSTVPQIMVEAVDAEEIKEEEEQIQGSGEGAPVVEDPQDESEEKQQDPSQNTEEDEQISKDDEKQTEDDVTEGSNEKPCGSDVSGTLETDGGEDTVIDENKRRTRRSRVTRSQANKQSPKKGTKGKR